MRLLAATSPESHGAITEGTATIGEITVGGTVAFSAFAGVAAGTLSVLLYALVGSLLPRGRAGGVTLGLVLLVLAGARLEPLRPDNFDFNHVGPDWLSAAVVHRARRLPGHARVGIVPELILYTFSFHVRGTAER